MSASAAWSSQAAKPLSSALNSIPRVAALLLGPLVAVEIDPHRERRVGDRLDKRRAPPWVADVEVGIVREDRLAAVLEVRMAVGAAVAPAAPGRGLLLR